MPWPPVSWYVSEMEVGGPKQRDAVDTNGKVIHCLQPALVSICNERPYSFMD